MLKRDVCQLCVALKTDKRFPLYKFLIQNMDGNCMFSHLFAKAPPGPKLANVSLPAPPPPKKRKSLGGLLRSNIALVMSIITMSPPKDENRRGCANCRQDLISNFVPLE